tara:strand:+ start:166 stop:333 length:168 start_codon:yes stop_codon:yes gene_type:complete
MLFCGEGENEELLRIDGVVWNIDENGDIVVDSLRHSGDIRWRHDRLTAAYKAADV